MAGEKYKIDFITNGKGVKDIQEPVGMDSIPFSLKQEDKRYGRDVFFGGDDKNEFKFYRLLDHEFENLLYDFNTTGWQTENKLIIEKDGIDNIIGDISYQYASTDQLEEFKCKVVQDSNHARLKRRSELKVNVFSEADLDGNEISGLSTKNVLVRSMPITKSSTWEVPKAYSVTLLAERAINNTIYYVLNPSVNLTGFDIDDSLTFFETLKPFTKNGSDFKIIEAKDNLKNISVDIRNLDFSLDTDVDNSGDGYADFKLELAYGAEYETAEKHTIFSERIKDTDPLYINKNDYSFEIPFLNRGNSVWLFYSFKIRQSGNPVFGNPRFEAFVDINSMNVEVTATRISYNTIVPSIRLIDGVKQVVNSISGLNTKFPFADLGGEMYDQRIFNGNLLRNLKDRAFNLTFKNFTEWLPEINGDYQVNDDDVEFLLYKDFYAKKEIASYDGIRFKTYVKKINPRYATNQFSYGYKKYQSQKENESSNTFDIVNGDSQWNVQNDYVENKKEISIPFVRDTFKIDDQRTKAFNLDDNTSTQDDDTVYILDTKVSEENLSFTETDFLLHTYDEELNLLKISNTGTFSFVLLGLKLDEFLIIGVDDINSGTYRIKEISSRYINLEPVLNIISKNGDGDRVTEFTYTVSIETAPFISWSNEGFSYVDGVSDSVNFANLKYSIKRNIKRFYNEYLATCNFWSKKPIKNTEYKNNGKLSMSYNGVQTVESEEFTPTNPILTPFLHEVTIIADFNEFISLRRKIKAEKGFIRIVDAKGHVLKLYVKEATFKHADEEGEIFIIGEEKFELSLINIVYSDLPYLTLNEEYRLQKLTYEIEDEEVSIKNEHGLLLYNPVYWHKVTVNGAVSESIEDLESKLKLLT